MSILSGIGQIPSVFGGGGGLTPSSTIIQTSQIVYDATTVAGASFNLSNVPLDNVDDPRNAGLVAGRPYHVAVQIQVIAGDGNCNSAQLDGAITFDFQWELPPFFTSQTLSTNALPYGLGTTPPILLDQTLTIPTTIPAGSTFILVATGNFTTVYGDGSNVSMCVNLFYTPATTN